jgi:hypothetical protein
MPRRNPKKEISDSPSSASTAKRHFAKLFAKTNRGLLLDMFVFVLNIFLMRFLTGLFIGVFKEVDTGNPLAQLALGLTFVAMWILPAAGAVLKRWHFHERLKAQGKTVESEETALAGCLFNPIFYFCLNLLLTAAVLSSLGLFLFGPRGTDNVAVFVPGIFLGMFLTIVQTYLIYRYFIPPKKPPKSQFLLTPQSDALGDVCLFLNMMLFQVFWNMLTFAGLPHPSGVGEFAGRLFVLCFIAMLVYFPPRMFYLVEDINRPRTWVTMLLANSPVIIRVLIGTSSKTPFGW